jgi:type II secretory pathway pseudopilin PulG
MITMKRSFKSMLGVTLLEIMLVLAIAAMVIVMSIRYYQSASTNQKINAAVNSITGIVAAGENYLSANGTFSGLNSSMVAPYLPGGKMPNSPWGGPMSISSAATVDYTIKIPNVPAAGGGCEQIKSLLSGNTKLSVSGTTNCLIKVSS